MSQLPYSINQMFGTRGAREQLARAREQCENALVSDRAGAARKAAAFEIVETWQRRFEWALRGEIPDWVGFTAFRCITDYNIPINLAGMPKVFPERPAKLMAEDCPKDINSAEEVWRAFEQYFHLRQNDNQKNMYSGKPVLRGEMAKFFADLLDKCEPMPGGQAGNILWLWSCLGAGALTHMPYLPEGFKKLTGNRRLRKQLERLELLGFGENIVSPKLGSPQCDPGIPSASQPRAEAPSGGSLIVFKDGRRLIYQFAGTRVLTMREAAAMKWDRVRFFHGEQELSRPPFEGAAPLTTADLVDLPRLVKKLQSPDASEVLSLWLRNQLAADTQALLTSHVAGKDDRLKAKLVEDLNRILAGGPIYTSERFAPVQLSAEPAQLVNLELAGSSLERLNRLLLQDAFPQELSRNPLERDSQDMTWPALPFFCDVSINANRELIVRLATEAQLEKAFRGRVQFGIVSGVDLLFRDPWLTRDRELQARLLSATQAQLETLANCGVRLGVELSSLPIAPEYLRLVQSCCRRGVVVALGINGEDELPGLVGDEALKMRLPEFWHDPLRTPVAGGEYVTYLKARRLAEATGVRTLYVHTNSLDLILRSNGDPGALLRAQQGDMMGKGLMIAALMQRAYGDDWLLQLQQKMPLAVKPEAMASLVRFAQDFAKHENVERAKEQLMLSGFWLTSSRNRHSLAVVPVMWPSPGDSKQSVLPKKLNPTGAGDMTFGAFILLGGV